MFDTLQSSPLSLNYAIYFHLGDGLYRRVIVVGLVGLSDITLDKENG